MLQSTRTLLTALAIGAIAACSPRTDKPLASDANGKTTVSPSGELAAALGKSMVRLVNALPGTTGVNVRGDKRTLFTSVGFKTVTPYVEVADNRVDFSLHQTAADSSVANNSEMLRDGSRYTIVALPGDKEGVQLRILKDEVATDMTKARVRVINAAREARNVDVALQGRKDPLFSSVGYGSEAGYHDIDPVTATVEIRRNDPSTRPVLIKNMRFEAGKSYSIVLTSSKSGGVEAITVQDFETSPTLSSR